MHRVAAGIASLFMIAIMPLSLARAQQEPPVQSEQPGVLRVFLDCQRSRCDFDHFRREIAFVDYVRDRRDADLHVLVTSQEMGSGGREYAFHFIGLAELAGREDTLFFASDPNDTQFEVRDGQTQTLKIGLLRYIANTPLANDISITYLEPTRTLTTAFPQEDPWNLWVFEVGLGGSLSGEETDKEWSLDGEIDVSRTTEAWKFEFDFGGSYEERTVELSEGTEKYVRKDFDGEALLVRSLATHWSAGIRAGTAGSTYSNERFSAGGGPALEYSFFPYTESTRRQVIVLYDLQVRGFDWEEATVLGETEEIRLQQSLELAAAVVQPWGTLNGSLRGSNYIHDFALHRVDLGGRLRFRIVRGLDFNMFGSFSRIKDQIHLPAEGVSDEERLIQLRESGTDFRYWGRVGFSYRFGSVFNNVVNPRMRRF
jgi:hypothetical protein